MTTQREPDTSAPPPASPVSALYNALAHLLDLYDREDAPTPEHAVALDAARQVLALADAAGQAAPVPPPVDGLETTEEERVGWINNRTSFIIPSKDVARLLRDFAKLHDRAEGLAKEVERLEARLAVYEAPLINAEVEALTGRLRNGLLASAGFVRDSKNAEAISAMQMAINDVDSVGETFRRLSAAHAECKGENTKPPS